MHACGWREQTCGRAPSLTTGVTMCARMTSRQPRSFSPPHARTCARAHTQARTQAHTSACMCAFGPACPPLPLSSPPRPRPRRRAGPHAGLCGPRGAGDRGDQALREQPPADRVLWWRGKAGRPGALGGREGGRGCGAGRHGSRAGAWPEALPACCAGRAVARAVRGGRSVGRWVRTPGNALGNDKGKSATPRFGWGAGAATQATLRGPGAAPPVSPPKASGQQKCAPCAPTHPPAPPPASPGPLTPPRTRTHLATMELMKPTSLVPPGARVRGSQDSHLDFPNNQRRSITPVPKPQTLDPSKRPKPPPDALPGAPGAAVRAAFGAGREVRHRARRRGDDGGRPRHL